MEKIDPPKEVVEKIYAEGAAGRAAREAGDLGTAEAHFLNAWEALPEPKYDYDYAQSLSRGLVEFFRDTDQVEKAREWMQHTKQAYAPFSKACVTSLTFLEATVDFQGGALEECFSKFDTLYQEFGKRPFQGADDKYWKFFIERKDASRD
jgi:hypothetical protein